MTNEIPLPKEFEKMLLEFCKQVDTALSPYRSAYRMSLMGGAFLREYIATGLMDPTDREAFRVHIVQGMLAAEEMIDDLNRDKRNDN